ncbi:amino acid permease [Saccharicrinis aurantiacus]|uniref:amino acid permease n=1 Tax=Saccharicrinis aurantiacus TaxID=1849719 RepID=UPI00249100AB|nr:amino acid permease [Saccharicrinis aurantiacus]
MSSNSKLGTAPVFFTAISTILGAILFLRFGYAVGSLGFFGALLIVLLGHLITLPTALAISEIATNTRVEGGGEYFIISRSFGLNIGATIGFALYLSQAISVAFYVIAFTEAFEPVFSWLSQTFDLNLPRQVISVPSLLILGVLILKKGANIGLKALYIIVAILFVSLALFFLGSTDFFASGDYGSNFDFKNSKNFYTIFAICFPAFTGMTAGVGLSGDLKEPKKSIPRGTIWGTLIGMVMYVFVIYKLSISASAEELTSVQLSMANIAIFGSIIIPFGLGASTISSAIGSVLVAPRTLQALANDKSFPSAKLNHFLSKGKGAANEPYNASLITLLIAVVFVLAGNVNFVAEIISMFFMITYGALCLISFLNHFGASPSYRPSFKSKWYLSLMGFVLSIWVMFKINAGYTIAAYSFIIAIYLYLNKVHKNRGGLQKIFLGALFQINRRIHVFIQNMRNESPEKEEWRPSAICISPNSLERTKIFDLMSWLSYKHGFGTYFHHLKGYYSKATKAEADAITHRLIERQKLDGDNLYIASMISPSYTTAIAQSIQTPSISGMENNTIIFEYMRKNPGELNSILDNINLTRAGNYDVCVFCDSGKNTRYNGGIHVWVRAIDFKNANLMILLGIIILAHPDWKKSHIKIFNVCASESIESNKLEIKQLIQDGRLPITLNNVEIIPIEEETNIKTTINQRSADAGFCIIGFRGEQLKKQGIELFNGFDSIGDTLFVNSSRIQEIE